MGTAALEGRVAELLEGGRLTGTVTEAACCPQCCEEGVDPVGAVSAGVAEIPQRVGQSPCVVVPAELRGRGARRDEVVVLGFQLLYQVQAFQFVQHRSCP
ncbi:hypothetical protein B0293_04540 [Amycolatopsis azurea DSM 43854]|uniref:Uncharacterized protein n=1 Tax=Amycolatopsis azurea DSM 43854 TaxID=1238180 RepID=A0ABX3JK47_9PSEU|nr:hypothetical protein B0293_04540 [Amycolatopsis azurea DSM 43854]